MIDDALNRFYGDGGHAPQDLLVQLIQVDPRNPNGNATVLSERLLQRENGDQIDRIPNPNKLDLTEALGAALIEEADRVYLGGLPNIGFRGQVGTDLRIRYMWVEDQPANIAQVQRGPTPEDDKRVVASNLRPMDGVQTRVMTEAEFQQNRTALFQENGNREANGGVVNAVVPWRPNNDPELR